MNEAAELFETGHHNRETISIGRLEQRWIGQAFHPTRHFADDEILDTGLSDHKEQRQTVEARKPHGRSIIHRVIAYNTNAGTHRND